MKQISTFLIFFLFAACNYGYSQCAPTMGTNGAENRIILTYADAAVSGAAIGVGSGATVTLGANTYTLEYHPNSATNIIRTGNEGGGTFAGIGTGMVTIVITASDGTMTTCMYNNGVLPVDLLSFTANSEKEATDNVLLEWATASELNNSHFIIEHSTDGRSFTALEKVEGMGTYDDLTEYSFTHKGAQNGRNFYRLQQVDFDGDFSFSSIEQVTVATNNISIKQTLVANALQVSFNAENTTDISYQVVNTAGQSVQTGTLKAYTSQQEINVSDLNNGIYFLQVIANGEMTATKFVKQ